MADHHDGPPVQPREPAHDRVIVGEIAVPGQRRVFAEQRLDVVAAMRPVGVTRDLAFTPGRQVLVEVAQQSVGLLVQRAGLFLDIHALARAGHRAQLFGLAFDFGQRLFEVEVIGHRTLQG